MKAQEVKIKVDGFEDFENKIKAVQSAREYSAEVTTMTKKEITASLRHSVNGAEWMNKSELAKHLGCDRKSEPVRIALLGLNRFGQKYLITEIAENICRNQA